MKGNEAGNMTERKKTILLATVAVSRLIIRNHGKALSSIPAKMVPSLSLPFPSVSQLLLLSTRPSFVPLPRPICPVIVSL